MGSGDVYKRQLDKLYINAETTPRSKRNKIRDTKNEFSDNLKSLYSRAHISDNPNDYNGADIQSYLRNDFDNDVYRDSLTRDFLFILTDGYQYVKGLSGGLNDWQSSGDLTDIETIVLEMDPKKGISDDSQLMKSKWNNWLSGMNAEFIKLQTKGSLRKIIEGVNDFVGISGTINSEALRDPDEDQGLSDDRPAKNIEEELQPIQYEESEIESDLSYEDENTDYTRGSVNQQSLSTSPPEPTRTTSSSISTPIPLSQASSPEVSSNFTTTSTSNRVDSDRDGVPDHLDNCTTRVGEATNNGCPVLQISATRTAIYRDMAAMPYEIERSSTLQSTDEYSWEVNNGGEIEGSKSQRCYVNFPAIGNYVVKCKLKGQDGYSDEIYLNQHVGIRYAELEGLFNQIAQYGNIAILGGNSEPVQKAKNEANSSISSIKAMISPSGCELLKERKNKSANTFFGDDLNSLFNMLQMAKSDPKLEIRDVSINHIGYDRSNGLIDEIRYSIL